MQNPLLGFVSFSAENNDKSSIQEEDLKRRSTKKIKTTPADGSHGPISDTVIDDNMEVVNLEGEELTLEGEPSTDHAGEGDADVSHTMHIDDSNQAPNHVTIIEDSNSNSKSTDFGPWMLAKKTLKNKTRVNPPKSRGESQSIPKAIHVANSRFDALNSNMDERSENLKENPQENIPGNENNLKTVGHNQQANSSDSKLPKVVKIRNANGGKNPQSRGKSVPYGNKPVASKPKVKDSAAVQPKIMSNDKEKSSESIELAKDHDRETKELAREKEKDMLQ
ncbi:hypothetical protein RIF29_33281 [Crotalaria pallida]|uniref:Uncharacterized protein n=1 Tax=Crotalaria pallida TaxID=3830 RepID=A0AAN9E857_CROPI